MTQFLAASRALPKKASGWPQGCTHRIDRKPDGEGHMETSCDKAAGAFQTFRIMVDSTAGLRQVRQHMEAPIDLGSGPTTMAMDLQMAQAGDCPAELQKPGTARMADGSVIDTSTILTALLHAAPPTPAATN